MNKKAKIKKNFPKIRLGADHIAYEDDNYIVINKKAGWICHKTMDPNRPNLESALKAFLKNRDKVETKITLIHRLDVWTSGLILFNKNPKLNKDLQELFRSREITKIYHALVKGSPQKEHGVLEHFLKEEKIGKKSTMTAVKSGGKKAITNYQTLESTKGISLIECEIKTGRKHQIRAQLREIGHPIIGDQDYFIDSPDKGYEGQQLNATRLKFQCPRTKKVIDIEIPLPFSLKQNKKSERDQFTYILFNKPYNVLSQFTKTNEDEQTLAGFDLPKDIYPVGRLDKDSEGLLILTDDGKFKHKLAHNESDIEKTYLVQVEGLPSKDSLVKLERGILIKGKKTLPAKAKILTEIDLWERTPPIRERKNIPTTILQIKIKEGRNRQVRRMTAAIGHPTLRLIRISIGKYHLPKDLKPGHYREIKNA